MNKRRWTVLALLAAHLVAFSIGSGSAYAYSTGGGYKWTAKAATYYTSTGYSAAFVTAIRAADTAWNGAGSSFRFSYGGTTARNASLCISGSADGKNDIGYGNLGRGTVGRTCATAVGTSFSEVDMALNTTYYAFTTLGNAGSYDVQNTVTHEFGHWLYLADLTSAGNPSNCGSASESTMCGSTATNETRKRSLATDDTNGIKAIYP